MSSEPTWETCPVCDGRGYRACMTKCCDTYFPRLTRIDCTACKGKGMVPRRTILDVGKAESK